MHDTKATAAESAPESAPESRVPLAYISHAQCEAHEMGQGHPECPERVVHIAQHLEATGLLAQLSRFEAPQVSAAQIERAHPGEYYERLRAASPARGYAQLDPDTAMNPATFGAARCAAGAAVLAADLICSGRAKRAFCNVRPPGHHALANRPMGFCFFNNVAVGIHHSMAVYGLTRVVLIDFDVHHGNGSEQIFANDSRVLMLSTFQSPLYPYSGEKALGSNMHNVPLPPHSGGAALRSAVTEHWLPRIAAFEPQMIWISAGFDAHEHDELAQLCWTASDYRWVTEQICTVAERHCDGRIASMLEGGYNLPALAASVEQHVRVLLAHR